MSVLFHPAGRIIKFMRQGVGAYGMVKHDTTITTEVHDIG
jgi:hypothetical protein